MCQTTAIGNDIYMAKSKYLEKASGAFFFSGFMLSKFQYLPFPIVAAAFRFVSLGIYLLGYSMWFLASLMQPEHKRKDTKWYGFAKFKEQFLFSSLIGFIATVVSVVAISMPILFPLAAWLYVLGNAMWAIGEYHKLKNPPAHDENFSYERQKSYFKYTATTTLISLVAAISSCLIIAFPLATIPITFFSLGICIGLGAFAFENWLDSAFGNHKPEHKIGSYNKLDSQLSSSCSLKNENEQEPYHGKSLFASSEMKKPTPRIETYAQPELPENADLIGLTPCSTL